MTVEYQATEALVHDLRKAVAGEVRFDRLSVQLYSTDASDFRKIPVGVIIPRHGDDVQAAVEIAARHRVPVIPRGGGSSLSGQTVGTGLIMDLSKYQNHLLQVNAEEKWVVVEAGVVLDVLNAALAPHGLMVGPDPSSSAVATMGGMAGNNSTGSHSIVHGMMADHVREMEVVLSDGSKAFLNSKSSRELEALMTRGTLEGKVYRQVSTLLADYADDIRTGYPRTWRNVAGYGLNRLLRDHEKDQGFNLASLVVGSEGTLAAITRIKLGVIDRPAKTRLDVFHFNDVQTALEQVPLVLEHGVSSAELMTYPTLKLAHDHAMIGRQLRQFVQGLPGAVLIVEFAGDSDAQLADRAQKLETRLRRQGYCQPVVHCTTSARVANVWGVRKSVFGLTLSKPGDDKPLWIIDDATVPVDELVGYTRDVIEAGRRFGIEINFDAHASAGCLHMGLGLNLKTRQGLQHLELLIKEIMTIAIAHGGTTTGEHGEGLARSYFNKQLYGERLHEAFRQVKEAFDPGNLMNPNKVVDAVEPWSTRWLKYHPGYRTPYAPKRTHFDYSYYGGYAGLVEMCNGQGICRGQVAGTMCPSYRVTRDEKDTTRGRANALRAAMTGQFGPDGLTSAKAYNALELCLECKACRNECSTRVDMAKLKYEFLSIYQQRHGVPLRSLMFGHMARAGQAASLFPSLANRLYQSKALRNLLDRTVRIDKRRQLPPVAPKTFRQWFRHMHKPAVPSRGRVVLWDDCHIRFHQPQLGRAAVKILEALGYEVICLEKRRCCGRPMISKGLLKKAAQNARYNIGRLVPYAREGISIIGVEPSCIACFRDEYPDLVRGDDARRVAGQSFFFEEFVTRPEDKERLQALLGGPGGEQKILAHTHCYQKALGTSDQVLEMLRLLPGADVEQIDCGCCGMAGSFGYEKEHYELSMAIGEQALFPAVRAASPGALIAAAGTSCREQIKDGTRRRALHPIEIIARTINSSGE